MGGFFGVISKQDCVSDLFYGTDYHSHLGTHRGGLAVLNGRHFTRFIHNIQNTQFRSKFEDDILKMKGNKGIGCISDTDDQPLVVASHLGNYAIVTVGKINNLQELVIQAFSRRNHFLEMDAGMINPTEMVAALINEGSTFEEGIKIAREAIEGSCSLLILSEDGIYAARDRFGRTPVIIGERAGSFCATLESCALPNLNYKKSYELGPDEIVLLTAEKIEPLRKPGRQLRICAFLWIYYGYPASGYEDINVEQARYRCGAALARRDNVEVDTVCGVPDSGIAHALGYAVESGLPYRRPFVKYTPTWPRSFMPQNQDVRNLVARMKLIPIAELIDGQRLLFCEDSIVRGTQLRETIQRIFDYGAKEVHMRPACPPLIFACPFINFSRSKSEMDLAARRAIGELDGDGGNADLNEYSDSSNDAYRDMVEKIRARLGLTTLAYQDINDMVAAIGLPKDRVCTYCWDREG